ncbi:7956_t:CDS:2 [Dentiscutata erythropus]|uniref:7956_t:CDS:1 n=1 Tax=Dentiscutata erythropus TaxID=1348616 RepID=A0A9N9AMC0_9GLOM|nr:7956_t:CDS:2 [Dentiscutata erythropus]
MTFFETLIVQNIFPPSLNDPNVILNELPRHFNSQSVTAYGVFKMNVHKEAQRLGVGNNTEINAVVSKMWNSASPADKNQYCVLASATTAVLPRRFPFFEIQYANIIWG